MNAVLQTEVPGIPVRRGKVRDVYDLGDTLAVVATDRISAFDWVMPNGIPGKGKLLSAMSLFWFDWLNVPHHVLSTNLGDLPSGFALQREIFEGRTMKVRKCEVISIECVARGYLAGSGWKEYKANGTVCGLSLPFGLREAAELTEPIFTPATKAESGHDENISFGQMVSAVGLKIAEILKTRTLDVYRKAHGYAKQRGIILADTKLEWGRLPSGEIILIDEVLTPDSSRYWPADTYAPGGSPPSYDKQFVRDYLESTGWDKNSPPPILPPDVVSNTARKYQEAYDRLTT